MTATMAAPRFFESGTVARRLELSATRLHELGAELGLPAARTDGGRRLWTEEDIAVLQRAREERQAARLAGRAPRAA